MSFIIHLSMPVQFPFSTPKSVKCFRFPYHGKLASLTYSCSDVLSSTSYVIPQVTSTVNIAPGFCNQIIKNVSGIVSNVIVIAYMKNPYNIFMYAMSMKLINETIISLLNLNIYTYEVNQLHI